MKKIIKIGLLLTVLLLAIGVCIAADNKLQTGSSTQWVYVNSNSSGDYEVLWAWGLEDPDDFYEGDKDVIPVAEYDDWFTGSDELWYGDTKVVSLASYSDSSCIEKEILENSSDVNITHVGDDGVENVTSVDNPDDTYGYQTDNGLYLSFSKRNDIYIFFLNETPLKEPIMKVMDNGLLKC